MKRPRYCVASAPEAAGADAYAKAWAIATVPLEAERLRALAALTEEESAERFARLLQLPLPYPQRPSSGLVEQQRIFARMRSRPG